MASEGDANKPMAEGLLKRVTGRDQITARFMRQEYFSFRPTFLLMLASNHRPRFVGQDDGLWRRVKLISWERYFTPDERDHGIFQRLLSERQGIAAWAVRGAVQYFATGSDGRKLGLQDPQSVVAATQNYKANADALAGFFPGRLVRDDDAVEVAQDVFTAYVEHCEAEHLPHKERWTRRAFYSALEERGVQRGTSNKGVRLHGVRLVADAADLNPISRGV
jgi:putative DNA primase/helicase